MSKEVSVHAAKNQQSAPTPARDLADFYLRWVEFRPHVIAIADGAGLSSTQAEMLNWLVELADKVGESDFNYDAAGKQSSE